MHPITCNIFRNGAQISTWFSFQMVPNIYSKGADMHVKT